MTSYPIESAAPASNRTGALPAWSRRLKYAGAGIVLLSTMPYLILATWVNLFAPEMIAENNPFGTSVDPISSDIGGWTFIICFPLGLALLLLGWVLGGHIKDSKRFGWKGQVGFGLLRLTASLGIAVLAATFTPILQLLLTFLVGRN